MFCPKCGSLLVPKKEDNKKLLGCSCGYKNADLGGAKIVENLRTKKEIPIIDREDNDLLPLTDAKCPKCGHEKAFYWMIQTRASDEPETKFLKCEKCKHTWRDYS